MTDQLADARPLGSILDRMEDLMAAIDAMGDTDRSIVVEFLDHVDDLHRLAMTRLGQELTPAQVEDYRAAHPAIAWLWEAYGVGLDPRMLAARAIDAVRPYLESHGGDVEVLDVTDGRVLVALSGSCSGCSASAITLQEGVEKALRDGFPDFRELAVEEDPEAIPHGPPGETLIQLQLRPGLGGGA